MTPQARAFSLSGAQKRAVLSGLPTLLGDEIVLDYWLDSRVWRSLRKKGLAYADGLRLYLTPLGKEVRAILENENG